MSRMLMSVALVAVAMTGIQPVQAGRSNVVELQMLAEISGLRLRQTKMLFAAARTSYPEYRYTFSRVEQRFIREVGRETYERLQAGLPVTRERVVDGERVTVVLQLDPSA